MNKKVISNVMEIAYQLAKEKKGSLFVISKKDISRHHERLYPELFKGKNVRISKPASKVLVSKLMDLDGALVLDNKGIIQAYGVKLKKTRVLFGHGTRHSAARGITKLNDVMSILSSEEDGMVRVFKQGEMIAEIDPDTGKNKNIIARMAELFSKPDIQIATSGGVASLFLGLNPLMAGAIFTGSWIITKYGLASVREFSKTGKIVIKEELHDELVKKRVRKS